MDVLGLSDDEWTAILLSLRVSFVAMLASLPFGILVAILLARGRFWGKSVLNGIIHLPLILPPVVTGFILLVLFGRRGPIGSLLDQYFGIVFSFRWTGAALACAVMGFPLMVRSIRLSIESVDRKLEEAAGTLGASPLWVFLTVTLPLTIPGIIAGMILCFAKAMGEFGAVSVVSGHIRGETNTLPLHVEILYNEYNFVAAFACASLLALLALVTLALKAIVESKFSTSETAAETL